MGNQALFCFLVGVILFLAATTYGQSSVVRINSISLTGGSSDSVGRINAEVILADSVVAHTAVCDSVDFITAVFICQKLGYIVASGTGTVSTMKLSVGETSSLIRNLTCEGAASYSDCKFQQAVLPSCSVDDNAAISCILTPGEVAGIAIGVLLGCLLLFCLPIIICCCCCCGLCACLTGTSTASYGKI